MKVAKYLGSTRRSEQLLAEAFLRVATKHEQEADIREVGKLLAGWSREHIDHLSLLGERYGEDEIADPMRHVGKHTTVIHLQQQGIDSMRVHDFFVGRPGEDCEPAIL